MFAAFFDLLNDSLRSFLIVHYFIKKSQKTPRKELDKALKRLEDYKERNC